MPTLAGAVPDPREQLQESNGGYTIEWSHDETAMRWWVRGVEARLTKVECRQVHDLGVAARRVVSALVWLSMPCHEASADA